MNDFYLEAVLPTEVPTLANEEKCFRRGGRGAGIVELKKKRTTEGLHHLTLLKNNDFWGEDELLLSQRGGKRNMKKNSKTNETLVKGKEKK